MTTKTTTDVPEQVVATPETDESTQTTWLAALLVLFGVGCAAFGIMWSRSMRQNQSVLASLRSHRNIENPVYDTPARTSNAATGIIDATWSNDATLNATDIEPLESGDTNGHAQLNSTSRTASFLQRARAAPTIVPVTRGLAQVNPTYLVPLESGGNCLYEVDESCAALDGHRANAMYIGAGIDEGSESLQAGNVDAEA